VTFVERFAEVVTPNPGGSDDPLGESVLDVEQPWLRVFEPRDVRLVIGRGQDPHRELQIPAAQADGVPVHRRVCGGGAVVLAPGMVVVALRLPRADRFPDAWLEHIGSVLASGLSDLTRSVVVRGHGDLALAGDVGQEGAERKILGSSLRLSGRWCYYLASLLLADHSHLMRRYLSTPSREPRYRGGRDHESFCTWLAMKPVEVIGRLEEVCRAAFT
jgi:lipoate---protein ligase